MWLTLLTVLCLGSVIGKPFNIDDPLFLWTAERIQQHPFDPYGFSVNWYKTESPMWIITKNPPGAAYFIAAVAWIAGWGEVALHTAFLIPALAVTLGTFHLAKRFCQNPLAAALATLFTPVFLVSSSTVMCDTMMLAFWVWAVWFWMRGLEESKLGPLLISGVLISGAEMTKYYGASLMPLLLVYGFLKVRKPGRWISPLIIPLLTLVAYQLATSRLYGKGLFGDAGEYSVAVSEGSRPNHIVNLLNGTQFAGGCLAWALFLSPFLWKRNRWLVCAGLSAIAGLALFYAYGFDKPGATDARNPGWVGAQASVWFLAGLSLHGLVVTDLRRRMSPESCLLAGWIAGTFIFASVVNWTMNARSILPIAPAAAILLVRHLEAVSSPSNPLTLFRLRLAFVMAAALSVWVLWSDALVAHGVRASANRLAEEFKDAAVKPSFTGHWGFQYYLQRHGFQAKDMSRPSVHAGELLIVPFNNTGTPVLGPDQTKVWGEIKAPGPKRVSTMNLELGAGYYANVFGPLAFGFGKVPPEGAVIHQFGR